MIKFFLARVLKWASGIPWEQFIRVIAKAESAAIMFPKETSDDEAHRSRISAQRARMVTDFILHAFPHLPTWAVNLLRELAVAWVNRGGKS